MTTPTKTSTPQLAKDLQITLARLRMARYINDQQEIRVSERRLNWLLDKLPKTTP
jgi:hypothetical protein